MTSSQDIIEFWFGELTDYFSIGSRWRIWFNQSDDIDHEIRARFASVHTRAAAGECDEWRSTDLGALALIIVLDQFSRHIHRGEPAAYKTDRQALVIALEAISAGRHQQVHPIQRQFFYLPLQHAENLELQARSVELFEELEQECAHLPIFAEYAHHARRMRELVARFGRIPHRNAILGRPSTTAEVDFLSGREQQATLQFALDDEFREQIATGAVPELSEAQQTILIEAAKLFRDECSRLSEARVPISTSAAEFLVSRR